MQSTLPTCSSKQIPYGISATHREGVYDHESFLSSESSDRRVMRPAPSQAGSGTSESPAKLGPKSKAKREWGRCQSARGWLWWTGPCCVCCCVARACWAHTAVCSELELRNPKPFLNPLSGPPLRARHCVCGCCVGRGDGCCPNRQLRARGT